MEKGDSIDRGRHRYLGSLPPAPLTALPRWRRGHKEMLKDTVGGRCLHPPPLHQLLPVINITRAQRGAEGMLTRWAEGLSVLTKVSVCRWALPTAGFRLTTPVPIPRQIPGGFQTRLPEGHRRGGGVWRGGSP